MSGSPVYYDGKLVGALSLKLGVFTKEAIGGVTPIENMLDVEKAPELSCKFACVRFGCQRANDEYVEIPSLRRAFPFPKISRARPAPARANFWCPSKLR